MIPEMPAAGIDPGGLTAIDRSVDDIDTVGPRVRRWLGRRRWALISATTYVVVGTVFSFTYYPVVHHLPVWQFPGDIWYTFRGAQYAVWGDFTGGLQFVSSPGAELLLTPAAYVANGLHLIDAFPFPIARPSAWLVLEPYTILISTPVIFALDRLAEGLGFSGRRRAWLAWAEAVAVFPIVVICGHPEDVVALSFALWALSAGLEGRWRRAGWFFGVAVLLQPIGVLVLLPALAMAPARDWIRVCVRAVLPTAAVMAIPLITAWSDTMRFLHEPNNIRPNHATPLLALAPAAGRNLVDAGPARLVCVVLAAAVGWYAYRRKVTRLEVVWLIGLVLTLRVVLEPVMDPFYLWPAVATLLLIASGASAPVRWASAALLGFATVYSFRFLSEWVYWVPLVLSMATVVVLLGWQVRTKDRRLLGGRGLVAGRQGVGGGGVVDRTGEVE